MKLPPLKGFCKKSAATIPLHIITLDEQKNFLKTQTPATQKIATQRQWHKAGDCLFIHDTKGALESIAVLCAPPITLYALAHVPDFITAHCDLSIIKRGFHIIAPRIKDEDLNNVYSAWALAHYNFDSFKKSKLTKPLLACPPAKLKTIKAQIEAIYFVRDLINMPPNKLGPAELAAAALSLAKNHKAKSKVIKDKKLETEFPLIHEVGKGSDRKPCLVDFTWGNPKHKKITLVGKGVIFDTGGYDIKPSTAMLLMKKDMGGAAMALGLAHLIMAHKLPVRLRVLIPIAENSISGNAYRPSDILTSRNGVSIEIGNTDAEGRLVMADCLAVASAEKPDLLVDFATLTGAARSALGFDLPALFSNDDNIAQTLQRVSMACDDPLWHMPLWRGYKKDILSPVADINNAGNNPAGAVTAALFLDHFVESKIKWIHIDHYAWEQTGRAGRPRGGTDMGMRAVFQFIESLK